MTIHQKRSTRVRCVHRYKGLFGKYMPRFKRTRDGYWLTQYKCQIIGCNHWQTWWRHKAP